MCNAWNHSASCDCGWGGSGTGGGNGGRGSSYNLSTGSSYLIVSSSNRARIPSFSAKTEEAQTYPTECWWCGALVYYHTNGYGDSVLFDSLGGCPWQVHSCWQDYWKKEKSRRQATTEPVILRSLESNQLKRLILAGAIHKLSSNGFKLTEEQVALQLGISVGQLRQEYHQIYDLYMQGGVVQVRLK